MNVISRIRKSLNEGYDYLINADTYNQLQDEWITRAKMEGWVEVSKIEELIANCSGKVSQSAIKNHLQKLIDELNQGKD